MQLEKQPKRRRGKKKISRNKTNLVCDRCVLQYTRRAIPVKSLLANIQCFARIIKFPTKRSEITNIKMLSTYPWLYIKYTAWMHNDKQYFI